ncbi:hypothetical protein ACIQTU_02405 [Brevundimonas sp. NPDC090276]|uniref:hypothetical protein n=1 Tax=Brevundimonas sp. NPDC090276 TaxID=3363956 RepID=UPI00383BA97D
MKMLSTVVAAVAMMAAAGSVSAQSFSPSSGSFSASGNVALLNSAGATCNVSLGGTIASSSLINITSKTFSPGPSITCGWAVTPYSTWHAETIPGNYNQIVIYLGANTIIGTPCKGWVVADVVNLPSGGSEIIFDNDELIDGTYAGGTPTGCYVVSGSVVSNVQLI